MKLSYLIGYTDDVAAVILARDRADAEPGHEMSHQMDG